MPENAAVLALPKVMDLAVARRLTADLLAARGKPVALDASKVQRVGGLCLQVMLSARRTWAEDRQAFGIVHPTPAFKKCLTQLGALDLVQGVAA